MRRRVAALEKRVAALRPGGRGSCGWGPVMGAAATVLMFGSSNCRAGTTISRSSRSGGRGYPKAMTAKGGVCGTPGLTDSYMPLFVNVPLVPVPVRFGGEVTATCSLQAPGHSLICCTCGIRYVPDARDFEAFLGYMKAGAGHLLPGWRLVAAHGHAEGAADFDVNGTAGRYWLTMAYRRCERFRITDLSYA